jgi:hypothetical protein
MRHARAAAEGSPSGISESARPADVCTPGAHRRPYRAADLQHG